MRRRYFISLLGGVTIGMPIASLAQQLPRRIARIGWLVTGTPTAYRFSLAAFQNGLEALGYKEGRNLVIEYRWAEGDLNRLPTLATELVDRKVDVILAGGNIGALAAKNATSEIPIVTAGAGDLVESGLVTNLARPEGNLTGFISSAPEWAPKRLQLIKEIMPQAKVIAVLWNPTSHYTQLEWNAIKGNEQALGVKIASYEIHNLGELEGVLIAVPKAHPDFLLVVADPVVFTYRRKIADAAAQDRLPAMYGYREFVDDGGLISYGTSISDTYRRAATYVDKIINGAKIGDLPVQEPTKFELVINIRTAKRLGLEIAPAMLARTDEVIE